MAMVVGWGGESVYSTVFLINDVLSMVPVLN